MFRFLNNKKVSKATSSFMLFVILFNNIIFPSQIFALTSGPSQPEFSTFDNVNSSEMVNLFTGDFSYNIPLMDVDGYPINIAYHGSPSMDQEASWVGLGWNINSGAINRGMRGLPDDFNGEEIKREINIKDFKAWGVGIGGGAEITGKDISLSANLSGGIGVTKSNYKGYGMEFFFEPTLSASMGDKLMGSLTAGLGVKASTTDGVDIFPQAGISGQYRSTKAVSSIGFNLGANYNSREGVKSVNAGVTASVSKSKKGSYVGSDKGGSSHYKGNGVGIGVGSSASIPASSQGFLPQLMSSMKSQSYSLDFKLGSNLCVVAPFGYVRGYYAQNGLASRDISLQGYGYMFSQNGDNTALHDFTREKDGMMYPETPNLPITNYSYDMFYASGQGMEMAFRTHRNDVGMLHDNPTKESSFGLGASSEVLVTPDVNVGVNTNVHWSNGEYGKWEEHNDMIPSAAFTSPNLDYEASYLKVAGEKVGDDASFINIIKSDQAVRVKLEKVSDQKWKATNKIENSAYQSATLNSNFKKSQRAIRNNLVSFLNAEDAKYAALEKEILNYNVTSNPIINPNYVPIDRIQHAANREKHISEVKITNPNGSRYVYGIPVYNRVQNEVMFNISGSTQTHSTSTHGLVPYSSADASKANAKGIDNFYENNTIPGYAHSYLLTALLSSDYVDKTGNGPSADDYGDYTKFNYSNLGDYNWRFPYETGKATFNQGFMSDKMDDKGCYVYGTKELWYPHSIETKNYIAMFIFDTYGRNDGRGAVNELGGLGMSGGTQQRYLKEIRLYSKRYVGPNAYAIASNIAPLKVVHFEYDYSLCPGVPNNASTATSGTTVLYNNVPINGKLTLKKVYFTYGNSNKGSLTPYTFDYCNGNYNNTTDNPTYDPSSIDRWGNFQKNNFAADNNLDFPYTKQNKTQADINARAWCLTQINTPSGSKIDVTYEADDYAFVQNKEAAQMYKVMGAHDGSGSLTNVLYGNYYIDVDLSSSGATGVNVLSSNPTQELKDKYLKGLSSVYLKTCVDLGSGKYEFVPLYAEIESISPAATYYTVNGINYWNLTIKLKKEGINDDGSSTKINPITKAAFQLGRMYLPGVVFPGSQTIGTNETVIKGLVTMVQDMKSMFSGINKSLLNRNVAKIFDPERSIAKLYNSGGIKFGGGSRVKIIEISDNWNIMSGEVSSSYGQEYSYTTAQNGNLISSGVASYEPLNGGDENSNRNPIPFKIKRVMAPNDEYFQEEPLGESFFPDPLVGYSKITVKNLDRTAQNVKKHATGKTEYEFYTSKDFPVIVERTPLEKQRVKPKLLKSLLKFGSTDKLYMSQGFSIKTNDMHGKPKGQKNYAEGAKDPYSGITYYYKTKTGTTNQLDNQVSVINEQNIIENKIIGQTTDFVTDSRSAKSNMWGAGVSVNVNLASCSFYVPLVFVWPSFSHDKREFHSISSTKVINQYGLVDYTEAFDNNSTIKTNNLLYDNISGEVVLTKTTNNFNDPVYNLQYPSYWAYSKMGPGYVNTGITVNANGFYNISSGEVTGSYFLSGDEILVKESFTTNNPIYTNVWVVLDKTNNKNYLVKSDGTKFTTTTPLTDIDLKITRSGNRNMQSLPMSSLVSLNNPSVLVSSTQKLVVNAATKVINSSAVEYSDNWQLLLGDAKSVQVPPVCVCSPLPCYSTIKNLITGMFTSTYKNVWNASSPNAFGGYCFSPAIYNNSLPTQAKFYGNNDIFKNFLQCTTNWNSQLASSAQLDLYFKKLFNVSNNPNPNYDALLIEFKLNNNQNPWPSQCYAEAGVYCTIQMSIENTGNTTNKFNDVHHISNFELVNECPLPYSKSQVLSTQLTGDFKFKAYTASNVEIGTVFVTCGCINVKNCPTPQPTNVTYVCGRLQGDIVNPYVENIRGNWRPKYNFSYLTDRTNTNNIKNDGIYASFKPYYDQQGSSYWLPIYNSSRTWDFNSSSPSDKWITNSNSELIDQNGNSLQVNDAIGRRSASIYGYNKTIPIAVASNAYYNQIAFDGFEDYDFYNGECSGLTSVTPSGHIEHFNFYPHKSSVTGLIAHTGRYSLIVPPGSKSATRKLTNPVPNSGTDNVPYTIKQIDDYGLFGPFFNWPTDQKFILSVWARENINNFMILAPQVTTYQDPEVKIKIGSNALTTTVKKSPIINGWQKLEYAFTIPASSNANSISIELVNNSTNKACLFDDIRIHPFNSVMKTMVYDPLFLRLMAEHDDMNYATFYEYDEEGTLVRIKKETEKGIYTIKETRSGLKK